MVTNYSDIHKKRNAKTELYGGELIPPNEGAERICILDVDFHHRNGTQGIFYERDDVLFISLHGQPEDAFPHFLGYANETGIGLSEGYNLNLPMPPGTGFDVWRQAFEKACNAVADYNADALIISLGTDTFEENPISFFKLTSEDFATFGEDLKQLNLPTLFVMEGGYAIDAIGINAINVLHNY